MIWIIGTGGMAVDYVSVLSYLKITDFKVVGRGEESATIFKNKTNISPLTGGLKKVLQESEVYPEFAIVAVGVEALEEVVVTLLTSGCKKILLEKPGAITTQGLNRIKEIADKHSSEVYIAYNRRFYSSVMELKKRILEELPLRSFQFEFTEWSHRIKDVKKPDIVKENWFIANSTHVVDLAFYLGGSPIIMNSLISGESGWHKPGSIFTGSGKSESGALFSYIADWEAPGRWGVEINTSKSKYILRPLEKLFRQEIGSLSSVEVEIDYSEEMTMKPGLLRQVKAFLGESKNNDLCTLDSHIKNFYWNEKMVQQTNEN